jgi:NAD(P)-dependent dehydrogenase (short-subunit alcohol dehydrogenase family)
MSSERKVAVITGASQGIGAGLVRGFLDRGYRVVANSRSIRPDASADMIAIAGDIADPAVAERVIGGAVEKFGRVDTLVNNSRSHDETAPVDCQPTSGRTGAFLTSWTCTTFECRSPAARSGGGVDSI